MHTTLRYFLFLFVLLLLVPAMSAFASEVNIPAGTLMECTLSEPNFSSATTSVGDPFLCYPRNLQEFGHPVFPRGAYIVGHLEDAKEPGHFVGKGYLRMAIDRIGLPSTDVPLRAKVISVAKYRVDKEGKVIGHGHPTRDVVEWMLPPLWPWKVLTLPAKGPRPALKGEVRVTMRVMDDFSVPQEPARVEAHTPNADPRLIPRPRVEPQKGWKRFGSPAAEYPQQTASRGQIQPIANDASYVGEPVAVPAVATEVTPWPAGVTVFQLKDGLTIPVQEYRRQGEMLVYSLDGGEQGSARLDSVDWVATARLNSSRGVRVTLRGQ